MKVQPRGRFAQGATMVACLAAAGCADVARDDSELVELADKFGICPEAAGFEEYQGDWLLAKACSWAVGEVADKAQSKLTSLAKDLAKSAINSYLPGVGSFLFGGGGDPFAAQAERIIKAIEDAKNEINSNTTYQVDLAIKRVQEWDTNVAMASFASLSERVTQWKGHSYDEKVSAVGASEIIALHTDLTTVRHQFARYIMFANANNSALQPYETVRLLHHYELLVDLEFQVGASRHYWQGLNGIWNTAADKSQAAVETVARTRPDAATQSVEEHTRGEIAADALRLFNSANEVADWLGNNNAILENTKWGAPTPKTGVAAGKREFAVQEGARYEAAGRDALGNDGWWDAGTVKVTWYKQPFLAHVGMGGDRFCSTPLFAWWQLEEWNRISYSLNETPENQKTYYQWPLSTEGTFLSSADPWRGIFYHGPRPHCAVSPSGIVPFPRDNPVVDSAIPPEVWGDQNILLAVDSAIDGYARESVEYANAVQTGYLPFRLALDKWWRNVRSGAPEQSTFRPYNALDAEHDRLLAMRSLKITKVIGASSELAMMDIVDHFMTTVDHAPSPAYRSKFVGYALQYGPLALLDLMNKASQLDADKNVAGRYPGYLHEVFIDEYAATTTPDAFYDGLSDGSVVARKRRIWIRR